jgi:hypothetical protein
MRRTIEYQTSRRPAGEPITYRIVLPNVVFVVSTYGEQIPDTIRGLPVARPSDLGSLLAPHLQVADPQNPLVGLEASALAIAATALRASGRVLREELTRERSRSRELEYLVYRLPAAEREGE